MLAFFLFTLIALSLHQARVREGYQKVEDEAYKLVQRRSHDPLPSVSIECDDDDVELCKLLVEQQQLSKYYKSGRAPFDER